MMTSKNNPLKVLIGVCSCGDNQARRRAIRETWLPSEDEAIKAVFFVGRGGQKEGDREPDLVKLEAPDDTQHLATKLQAFFRYALDHHPFDRLFLCRDDTYLAMDRLTELAFSGQDSACGDQLIASSTAKIGGGWMMTRDLVGQLAEDGRLIQLGEGELILRTAGTACDLAPQVSARLCADEIRFPRPDNDLVTAHGIEPEKMHLVHTIYTQEPSGRIHLDLSGDRGLIHLFENGHFARWPESECGWWNLDGESNLQLEFCGIRGRVISPIGALDEVDDIVPRRIGIIIIATGRYRGLLDPLFRSIRSRFLSGHELTIFLFSDVAVESAPDVRVIPINHSPWPGPALFRYSMIKNNADVFSDMDYLFYLDADMRVDGHVWDELLGDGICAVLHPSYFDGSPDDLPYERNPASMARVAQGEGEAYYCGAVQGGTRESYLEACVSIAECIDQDAKQGVTAIWHDESHWNRYLIDHPPETVLSPSYCYPVGWRLPFPPKIMALEKDHEQFRNPATPWPVTIVVMLAAGLGNQMFQYAHGLALARYFGAALELRHSGEGPRLALHRFGLKVFPAPNRQEEAVVECFSGYQPESEVALRRAVEDAGSPHVRVKGYFQNERYFEAVAAEVRRRFQVAPELPAVCGERTPVCLQIRRGDYLGDARFDLCTVAYFRDAMSIIKALVEKPMFFVVSDDLDWCRAEFRGQDHVFVPSSQTDHEGLMTMAACDAFVISNSSYGWWGAWLRNARIVIAPDPWLSDQPWDCIPSRWIRIPAAGLKVTDDTTEMSGILARPIARATSEFTQQIQDAISTSKVSVGGMNDDLPLISCVMPTYGRPAYVNEAIQMFLDQDYPNKELVILNDCVGQKFVCDLPPEAGVRVINHNQRFASLGDKRNACIELAKGALIAIWDDDDIYLPWRLSHSYRLLKEHVTPFFLAEEFYEYWGAGEPLHDKFCGPGQACHPNTLFTKSLWQAVHGYPSMNVGEDSEFFRRVKQLLQRDTLAYPIEQSGRFFILRAKSDYPHVSMNGGSGELDTRGGEVRLQPRAIADPTLRSIRETLILRHHRYTAALESSLDPMEPIISVCISLKNRSAVPHGGEVLRLFPNTVRSLAEAAKGIGGSVELVVADFGSDDDPPSDWLEDVAEGISVKLLQMEGTFSKGRGLNEAVRQSRSERLLLTDADVLISANALRRAIDLINQDQAWMPIFHCFDETGHPTDWLDEGYGIVGLAREAFDATGGVPEFESWGGEDDVFSKRVQDQVPAVRERCEGLRHQWHPDRCRHEHYRKAIKEDFEDYIRSAASESVDGGEVLAKTQRKFKVLQGEHPSWVGPVHLYDNGRFVRPEIDSGIYEIDERVGLTLRWDRWPAETLLWDAAANRYRSDDNLFTLQCATAEPKNPRDS